MSILGPDHRTPSDGAARSGQSDTIYRGQPGQQRRWCQYLARDSARGPALGADIWDRAEQRGAAQIAPVLARFTEEERLELMTATLDLRRGNGTLSRMRRGAE